MVVGRSGLQLRPGLCHGGSILATTEQGEGTREAGDRSSDDNMATTAML